MKHIFSTILCLMLSLSMGYAKTHSVLIQNGKSSLTTLTVTDQLGTTYALGSNNIEEGTILTFTLSNSTDFYIKCTDRDNAQPDILDVTTYEITASSPARLRFLVVERQYIVNVWVKPSDGGTISSLLGGFNVDPDEEDASQGKFTYIRSAGTTIDFTANPATNYEFLYWKDNGSTNPNRTITISSNMDLYPYFASPILDNESATYYDNVLSLYPSTINFRLKNRTLKANMWNTICLPFSLSQEQMEAVFGANAVAAFHSAKGDYQGIDIVLDFVTTGGMAANRPYLVYPATDIIDPVFEMVTPASLTNPTAYSDGASAIKLQGTLRPTPMTKDNKQTLCIGANNTVYFPNVSNNIKAFRAYFVVNDGELPQSAPERARFLVLGRDVPADYNAAEINNNNTRKYILDGQLIIEKDGIRYNAQGMIVE